jgi:phenylpyruvate tautomerase PptA (4-oxalocrotonate tautomerase family)
MDDPLFLQALQKTLYKQDQVKSIEQITTEYLGKTTSTIAVLIKLI